jgi:hypothetical protein
LGARLYQLQCESLHFLGIASTAQFDLSDQVVRSTTALSPSPNTPTRVLLGDDGMAAAATTVRLFTLTSNKPPSM